MFKPNNHSASKDQASNIFLKWPYTSCITQRDQKMDGYDTSGELSTDVPQGRQSVV
jgi:hypothetical protein